MEFFGHTVARVKMSLFFQHRVTHYLLNAVSTYFLRHSGASKVRTPDLISASEENVTVFPTYYITKPFEPDINQLPTTFRGFKSSHTRFDHKKADFCHIRPISADIGLGQNFYYFLGTWEMITFRKWHLRLSGASKFRTLDLIQKGPKIGQFRPILALEENLTIFLAYYMTRRDLSNVI